MAPTEPVPSILTTLKIQEVLEKNFEYIKVISDYQKRGMLKDALQYQQLLKNNLSLLVSQAERTPPSDINQVLSHIQSRTASNPMPGVPSPGACPAYVVPMSAPGSRATPAMRQTSQVMPAATPLAVAAPKSGHIVQGAAPLSAQHMVGAPGGQAGSRPPAASSLTAAVAASKHLQAAGSVGSASHLGVAGRQPSVGQR